MNNRFLLENYKRFNLTLAKGRGALVWSDKGDKYLDFTSGVAVNALGHCNPELNKVLKKQSKKLWHCSNYFYNEPAIRLAEVLVSETFQGKVFFCNSGTEANETLIKAMRKYWFVQKKPHKNRIITFAGAFHGRTIASISASLNPVHIEGFAPLLDGFDQVEYGNLSAFYEAITDKTAGVLIEPIQGEGGVNFAGFDFLEEMHEICRQKNILFAVDEVQSGVYRTGKMFAYQNSKIKPDLLSFAKGIGGGFPLGGVILSHEVANAMQPGSHGSTFGGNPLACSIGLEVINQLKNEKNLQKLLHNINFFDILLHSLQKDFSKIIKEIRGFGMLRGVKLSDDISVADFLNKCCDAKLLLVGAGQNVVRILPPLISRKKDFSEFDKKIRSILQFYEG
jgi:acetylornithine/N-succinyldiaminopimelate aminotransferase